MTLLSKSSPTMKQGVKTVAGNETTNDSGWRLDKRVPIPLLVVLMLQAMGAVWWAATMEGRVTATEAKFEHLSAQSEQVIAQDRRVAVVETKIDNLSQDIRELKNLIEKRYRDP